MTSQTRKLIILIHILPDIASNKDNQTMKVIFLGKSCAKCDKETSPKSFLKISK